MKISNILCVVSFAVAAFSYTDSVQKISEYNYRMETFQTKVNEINSSVASAFHDDVPNTPYFPDEILLSVSVAAFCGGIGVGLLISIIIKRVKKLKPQAA